MEQHSVIFRREGSFVRFDQYGLKLNLSDDVSDTGYYQWLDEMIAHIGEMVAGGAIVEKDDARTYPRYNAGVYYDTADYRLLRDRMVLRTTCNPITHSFCAFKYGQDENHVMRDHRHIFEGAEVPVYPRIKEHVASDPRVQQLIMTLSSSLIARFGANVIQESKYQRAAAALDIGG